MFIETYLLVTFLLCFSGMALAIAKTAYHLGRRDQIDLDLRLRDRRLYDLAQYHRRLQEFTRRRLN